MQTASRSPEATSRQHPRHIPIPGTPTLQESTARARIAGRPTLDRTERIVLLHRLLSTHRMGLSSERLMEDAQCSRATLYRDLELLRDTLGAPVESDGKKPNTWRYAPNEQIVFQLPGVWLSAEELYALLLAQQVLKRSGAESLLGDAMGHLKPRLSKLLGPGKTRRLDRLRVLRAQARGFDNTVFRIVAEAVLEGCQLRFAYSARSTAQITERTVSPQRLTANRRASAA